MLFVVILEEQNGGYKGAIDRLGEQIKQRAEYIFPSPPYGAWKEFLLSLLVEDLEQRIPIVYIGNKRYHYRILDDDDLEIDLDDPEVWKYHPELMQGWSANVYV